MCRAGKTPNNSHQWGASPMCMCKASGELLSVMALILFPLSSTDLPSLAQTGQEMSWPISLVVQRKLQGWFDLVT